MRGILLLTSTINEFTLLEIGTGFLQGAGLPLLHIGIQIYFQKSHRQSSNSERLAGPYFHPLS